ncbi:MAG: MGMT family protein [Anaerolineae bacterium]|nr:MGMT family protein [Anaerolineae bacterium]
MTTQAPPDPHRFNALVWQIVRQIPAGAVSTYGQIASMIPPPDGVEEADYERFGAVWVGKAMNAVSGDAASSVPWQRVINSQGGISLPEGSRAAVEQRARLESEGVTFERNGRVNLNTYGWDGPDAEWLRENRLLTPRPLKKPKSDNPEQLTLF